MADLKEEAIRKLISVACCVKKRNTPEFMAYLAEVINFALESCGNGSRVHYPGKWSNEFHLEIDGSNIKPIE